MYVSSVMIISRLEIVPTSRKREAVLDILRSVETFTRMKAGCLNCGIYERHSDERTILYIEEWDSREELYDHIRSDLYFRILAVMELATRVPQLHFHEASETMGMELIRQLRSQQAKV
jgi:quinol monooxygenase YgiN